MYKYNLLTFSGTFDRLHKGHKWMLEEAFRLSKTVLIGITSDEFIKNKSYSHAILPYQQRGKELTDYLSSHQWKNRSRIFTLNDAYGSAPTNNKLEAILVTRETLPNALKINRKRKEKGITPLTIEIRKLIHGDDHKPIRSERVRFGEITRNGVSYRHFFKSLTSDFGVFTVPKILYPELRKPLGKVISDKTYLKTTEKIISFICTVIPYNHFCHSRSLPAEKEGYRESIQMKVDPRVREDDKVKGSFSLDKLGIRMTNNSPLLITIGDVISDTLIEQEIIPDVYIIDYKNERKRIKGKRRVESRPSFINKSGTLSHRACKSVKNAIDEHVLSGDPIIVPIKGEEDLLAIPAILFAPLGSLVLYGQRNLGVVAVNVDEQIKKKLMDIISGL